MGNIIVSGVISKGGSQPFNAIEFYAVNQGDSVMGAHCDNNLRLGISDA